MGVAWEGILGHVAHRPWPLPSRPYLMTMSWVDSLFAHYEVDPAALQSFVPAPLELDTHEGRTYLGVVPFRMEHVGPRGLPLPAALSAFPELNLRIYVTHGGRPGVLFLTLDATNPLAIAGARAAFHLGYQRADIRLTHDGEWIHYRSKRRSDGGEFLGRYRPTVPCMAPPGSLDAWLTERYCLYVQDPQGRVHRGEVHHRKWPLFQAELELEHNTVADAFGFELDGVAPDHLHFSPRVDVVGWSLDLL